MHQIILEHPKATDRLFTRPEYEQTFSSIPQHQ